MSADERTVADPATRRSTDPDGPRRTRRQCGSRPYQAAQGAFFLALPVTLRDSLAIVGPEARAVDTAGAAAPLKVIAGAAEVLVEARVPGVHRDRR